MIHPFATPTGQPKDPRLVPIGRGPLRRGELRVRLPTCVRYSGTRPWDSTKRPFALFSRVSHFRDRAVPVAWQLERTATAYFNLCDTRLLTSQ